LWGRTTEVLQHPERDLDQKGHRKRVANKGQGMPKWDSPKHFLIAEGDKLMLPERSPKKQNRLDRSSYSTGRVQESDQNKTSWNGNKKGENLLPYTDGGSRRERRDNALGGTIQERSSRFMTVFYGVVGHAQKKKRFMETNMLRLRSLSGDV